MNAMDILLRFVAGDISVKEFENELYTNKELNELLQDPTINWSGTYISKSLDLYHYLIELNYARLESKADAIGALELFFQRKGMIYTKANEHSEILDLMLSTQPKYIDVDSSFFEKYILPTNRNLSKTELRLIIKANFNKHFKYQSRPPQWIQNPSWIVRDDKPLFFIGQLELKNEVAHDHGFVYVFLDTETGIIDTVTQFY